MSGSVVVMVVVVVVVVAIAHKPVVRIRLLCSLILHFLLRGLQPCHHLSNRTEGTVGSMGGSIQGHQKHGETYHSAVGGGWVVGGGWWLVADGWWLVAGGWWLVAGSWWLVAGSWWLVAGGCWLIAGG